jgi:hypothetical protein
MVSFKGLSLKRKNSLGFALDWGEQPPATSSTGFPAVNFKKIRICEKNRPFVDRDSCLNSVR